MLHGTVRNWSSLLAKARRMKRLAAVMGALSIIAGGWATSPAFGQQGWPWAGGYRPVQPPVPPG